MARGQIHVEKSGVMEEDHGKERVSRGDKKGLAGTDVHAQTDKSERTCTFAFTLFVEDVNV